MTSMQDKIDTQIKAKNLYFVGESLPLEFYSGFKAWLKLAQAGDVKAMVNVAWCYSTGEGVDKNSAESLEWYRRAADQGDPRAQFATYEKLKNQDNELALRFLSKAIANNFQPAINLEKELNENRQIEMERQQQKVLLSEVQARLDDNDRKGARAIAERAMAEGQSWAGGIVAALETKIVLTTFYRKDYHDTGSTHSIGNGMGGFTTYKNYRTTKKAFTSAEFINPTDYPVTLYLNDYRTMGGLVSSHDKLVREEEGTSAYNAKFVAAYIPQSKVGGFLKIPLNAQQKTQLSNKQIIVVVVVIAIFVFLKYVVFAL